MSIVAAVGSPSSSEVVKRGYELSDAYNDDLILLHVFSREEFEDRAEGRPDYHLDDGTDDAAQVSAVAADAALPDDAKDVLFRGRIGDPTEEIIDEARRSDARYIVIGGRNRSPVGKAVFGSTTQSVLLNATVPVVTVMH